MTADAGIHGHDPACDCKQCVTAQRDNTNAALREKLIDMIAEHLSGTYRCLRVWEAWNFGTMSQDDFDDVGESDTPPELADAILAALSTAARRQQPIWQATEIQPRTKSG